MELLVLAANIDRVRQTFAAENGIMRYLLVHQEIGRILRRLANLAKVQFKTRTTPASTSSCCLSSSDLSSMTIMRHAAVVSGAHAHAKNQARTTRSHLHRLSDYEFGFLTKNPDS